MKLRQANSDNAPIPLVPMIDVLMIMLVFFMVTSSYLNLRMIPFTQSEAASPSAPAIAAAGPSDTVLLRLDSDGTVRLHGAPVERGQLVEMLRQRLTTMPNLNVVLLPSGHASAQELVSLLDATTAAGVTRMRLVRLETAR
ncbi:ExbD/TolR family protein [Aliiruegeria sabulilitoris]|uniref:ExbD/TolR family protein n=1 Tax=Aliiruegeria sabulilitoris TaxID=1510458 RepID=UPI00082B3C30|nr:biopolymer transporter ExbD [Aliiruegeria sabulilitoris]NDR56199.1 biopolymer transporter ExbD [Pseudoruegeria sp. M32A2M]